MFEIKGLDEFKEKIEDLANRAEKLGGTRSVPLPDLLTPAFLRSCSRFTSVEEMFEAGGFKFDSVEEFEAIPEERMDAFIKSTTSYESWNKMLEGAAAEWTKNQLGL